MFSLIILLTTIAGAEIIDRVGVSVGNRVITESELLREIRIIAYINHETPDFSAAARRKTAERLVEQKLVRRELEFTHYPMPSAAEVDPALKSVQKKHSPGDLEKYGITEEDLKAHLLWQRTLLRFIEVRFRPEVQVSEEEIRNYFETHFPADRQGALEDYHDKIEHELRGQRIDKQLEDWLKEARQRTRVTYYEGVFQ